MKKISLLILFSFLISIYAMAQNASQLIRLNNVADNNVMNAISSPNEGSLVYFISTNNIYYYGNGTWNLIGGSGAITDTNDDAWGVTGEDIASDISRTGKVTIGQAGSTTVKLDVNGRTIVRNLPIDEGINAKSLLHSTNGELRSDKYTVPHSYILLLTSDWQDLCFAKNGATVTGFYTSNSYCSEGHFQFKYQNGQSVPFFMVYHLEGPFPSPFTYDSSTGIYTSTSSCGPDYAAPATTQFRVVNDILQVRNAVPSSPMLHLFYIRVEGY